MNIYCSNPFHITPLRHEERHGDIYVDLESCPDCPHPGENSRIFFDDDEVSDFLDILEEGMTCLDDLKENKKDREKWNDDHSQLDQILSKIYRSFSDKLSEQAKK